GLLLFAQLQAVAHDFSLTVLAMLAGSEVALLHRTFFSETLCAFEEQLHALAATEATDGASIWSQVFSPLPQVAIGLRVWLTCLPDLFNSQLPVLSSRYSVLSTQYSENKSNAAPFRRTATIVRN